jgi:NADH-quinone oxidoreductase subunit J
MMGVSIFFWFFGIAAILFASGVWYLQNLLHAAYALMGCMISSAGLLLLCGAPFVGFSQLLVYVGGILILIIFGVFLTQSAGKSRAPLRSRKTNLGVAVVLVLVLVVYYKFVANAALSTLKVEGVTKFQQPSELGIQLVTYAAIPFQLVAILLLVVLVGATLYASEYEKVKDE